MRTRYVLMAIAIVGLILAYLVGGEVLFGLLALVMLGALYLLMVGRNLYGGRR